MPKMSPHDLGDRLEYAEGELARTLDRRLVERRFARKYNVSLRTARRYTRAVRRKWEVEAVDDDRAARRWEIRSGYRVILQEAYDSGQLKTALMALRAIAELDGLNAPMRHEVGPAKTTEATPARIEEARRVMLLKTGNDG